MSPRAVSTSPDVASRSSWAIRSRSPLRGWMHLPPARAAGNRRRRRRETAGSVVDRVYREAGVGRVEDTVLQRQARHPARAVAASEPVRGPTCVIRRRRAPGRGPGVRRGLVRGGRSGPSDPASSRSRRGTPGSSRDHRGRRGSRRGREAAQGPFNGGSRPCLVLGSTQWVWTK